MQVTEISEIIGLTPVLVEQFEDVIKMHFSNGQVAEWYHIQDCCESVEVEDVVGDWSDLYGHPLLVAEERTKAGDDNADGYYSETWTFYTFRNLGGSVDVRWHGSSNGYYSERVDFSLS